MTKVNCLNPISNLGLDRLNDNYEITENFADADGGLGLISAVAESYFCALSKPF